MHCSVILLAAGQSQRLGINKLILPYKPVQYSGINKHQPIILHSLYSLIRANIPEIIIVLGYQGKIIKRIIQSSRIYRQGCIKTKIKFIYNRRYKTGMASSISTGMSQVLKHTDVVLIYLADKPGIKTKTIIQIILHANHTRKSIVVPVYMNKEGHPVLFKKKYYSQLQKLYSPKTKRMQDYGARNIINRYRSDISRVKVDDIGIIQDIDTWQDYIRQIIAP